MIEQWVTRGETTCRGCQYLASIGYFPAGSGPQPPFHPNCDCRRVRVRTYGLSTAAVQSLIDQALRNARRAATIVSRAWWLMQRSR
jgi:hypothetical protein